MPSDLGSKLKVSVAPWVLGEIGECPKELPPRISTSQSSTSCFQLRAPDSFAINSLSASRRSFSSRCKTVRTPRHLDIGIVIAVSLGAICFLRKTLKNLVIEFAETSSRDLLKPMMATKLKRLELPTRTRENLR